MTTATAPDPKPPLPQLEETLFYRTLDATPGEALVFFSKPGCGACGQWRRLLGQLAQLRPEIRVFEVDAERNMALAREYELFHLPALFLFRDGDYHGALQVEARLPQLLQALDALRAAPPAEAP